LEEYPHPKATKELYLFIRIKHCVMYVRGGFGAVSPPMSVRLCCSSLPKAQFISSSIRSGRRVGSGCGWEGIG